jgi:2-oxoglutarate ferredoxin oxidoreductase subunit gamma
MTNTAIRFAGFGGQGVVKAGEILGMAAVAEGQRALQNQSYGSSARGGLCTADVSLGPDEIFEIEPDAFDVLVLLSQDSCAAFLPLLREGGTLIYDADLVKLPEGRQGPRAHGIPATKIAAEELGRKVVTNMVVLGFCAAITGLLPRPAIEQAIVANVPKGTEELNLRAFAAGFARHAG